MTANGNGAIADHGAERAVLGSFLLDPSCFGQVSEWLRDDDFHEPRHRLLYRAVLAASEHGEPADTVTLPHHLRQLGIDPANAGGVGYIAELSLCVPTAVSVGYYARQVADCAARRRLLSASTELQRLAHDDERTLADCLDDAERMVLGVNRTRDGSRMSPASDVAKAAWAHLDEMSNARGQITGVPTGFGQLDSVTQGMHAGELTMLAARPSIGKSAMALNIAVHAAEWYQPTVLFSLEMSKALLGSRLLSGASRVDSHALRSGTATDDQYARVARCLDGICKLPLWFDDSPQLTIHALKSRCRSLKTSRGLALVIVDYLQLMKPQDSRGNRVDKATEISGGLKDIARELGVAVLALSQLSRQSEHREDKRPQLSDLRESGSLEQDADVVLLLHRPGKDDPTKDRAKTDCIVAKNRNGPTAVIQLMFDPATTAFSEPVFPAEAQVMRAHA